MLPNFLVIGAAKSATTSLCELLGQHPDVFILDPKEPHFFTRHYELGWKWYKSLFSNAGSYERIGEGSTSYSQKGLYPGLIGERDHLLCVEKRITSLQLGKIL